MRREIVCSHFVGRSLRWLLSQHPFHLSALRYLERHPRGVSIEDFDRVHAPRGDILRLDLAPLLIAVQVDSVTITAVGRFAIEESDQPGWNAEP